MKNSSLKSCIILASSFLLFALCGCDTLENDHNRYEIVTCGNGSVADKDQLDWTVCMLDRKTGDFYLGNRAPSLVTGNIQKAFEWTPWLEVPQKSNSKK